MFSANENIQLRQHKRRVVEYIEHTIPDAVLDLGVNVMVMQVSCQAPGCVPLETAIVIVFPSSTHELLPGLPESAGKAFKTKVLKPLAAVERDDILDALPPQFTGGRRSMERLGRQARDVMLGQITQLFGEDETEARQLLARYLQQSLQTYLDRGCVPPEWGQDYPDDTQQPPQQDDGNADVGAAEETNNPVPTTPTEARLSVAETGNVVLLRPPPDDDPVVMAPPSRDHTARSTMPHHETGKLSLVNTETRRRQQQEAQRKLQSMLGANATTNISGGSNGLLSQLAQREHAPGIRRAGCPCCDPDHPSNVVDQLMLL